MIGMAIASSSIRFFVHFLFLELPPRLMGLWINFALLSFLGVAVKLIIMRFKGLIRYAHLFISVSCMVAMMEDSIQ